MDKKLVAAVTGGIIVLLATGGFWLTVEKDKEVKEVDSKEIGGGEMSQVTLVKSVAAAKLIDDPQTFVIDVHTPEQEHILGTDAFIPYDKISQSADQLPVDKDTPILVYCRSGSMSSWAGEDLVEMGYTQVYDLAGGKNDFGGEEQVGVLIRPEIQDLGTVIWGEVATTEFVLTNRSASALNITRVTTSCSCTSAKAASRSLASGESTTVKVSFDPAVHKDDTDVGEITRTIFIDTDHPEFLRVEASIEAIVIKES